MNCTVFGCYASVSRFDASATGRVPADLTICSLLLMRSLCLLGGLTVVLGLAACGTPRRIAPMDPVIDMHLHIEPYDAEGPPPLTICAPYESWPALDPAKGVASYVATLFDKPSCARSFVSATSDDDLRRRTLAALTAHNVYALGGGDPALVARWQQEAGGRIIPAVDLSLAKPPSIDALRTLHAAGRLKAIAEVLIQYEGIAVTDGRMEPYFALAESLDVPVGIHMGPGPPGIGYFAMPGYRMALTDPLALEPVLVKHPKLRVFVMHAGWPMLERMIALMYSHPQVYVDVGVLDTVFPPSEFYRYVHALTDAGFGERIMFGSDQMVWPELIETAIDRVQQAPNLSTRQKRAILYDNAAKFLRLDPDRTR